MTFVTQRPTDNGAIRKKRKNQTWNKRAIADYREHDDKFTDQSCIDEFVTFHSKILSSTIPQKRSNSHD